MYWHRISKTEAPNILYICYESQQQQSVASLASSVTVQRNMCRCVGPEYELHLCGLSADRLWRSWSLFCLVVSCDPLHLLSPAGFIPVSFAKKRKSLEHRCIYANISLTCPLLYLKHVQLQYIQFHF